MYIINENINLFNKSTTHLSCLSVMVHTWLTIFGWVDGVSVEWYNKVCKMCATGRHKHILFRDRGKIATSSQTWSFSSLSKSWSATSQMSHRKDSRRSWWMSDANPPKTHHHMWAHVKRNNSLLLLNVTFICLNKGDNFVRVTNNEFKMKWEMRKCWVG